jgi:hypothetical protein
MENDLTLSEKLLLLAIRPGKGGINGFSSHSLDFALLGAVVLEMTLDKGVIIADKRVEVISAKYSSEAQKYLLEKMSRSSKPRKISHWMGTLAVSKQKLKRAVYESLVKKKEVKLEDRHFLFFRWKKPFLHPMHHATQVINEVKDMVMRSSDKPEDIFLMTLLESASLLRRIYSDRQARRSARKKISNFQTANADSETVKQAIDTARAVRASVAASAAAAAAAHG